MFRGATKVSSLDILLFWILKHSIQGVPQFFLGGGLIKN